MIITADVLIT